MRNKIRKVILAGATALLLVSCAGVRPRTSNVFFKGVGLRADTVVFIYRDTIQWRDRL